MSWKEYVLERFCIKERNVSIADRKTEEAVDRGDKERAKAERHRASRNECYIEGLSMNGKWISCDDLLPSLSYKGLYGFVLCHTEGRVEWGRYTSCGWYGIEGTAMKVSAWYDANYTGLIKGILSVQA